jgi:hypothetical protein
LDQFTCDVEEKTMKTQVKAVVAGALVTLFLWAIAFVILISVYRGNFPWLLTGLVAFLCPLVGGYVTALLGQTDAMRLGALAGLGAGLAVLLLAVMISRLAPNMTLCGAVLVIVGMVGGALGTLTRYLRQK